MQGYIVEQLNSWTISDIYIYSTTPYFNIYLLTPRQCKYQVLVLSLIFTDITTCIFTKLVPYLHPTSREM